jgi:hypothetical protein
MSSSSSSQDSASLDEPQPLVHVLDNIGTQQVASIRPTKNGSNCKVNTTPKKLKNPSKELLESDLCNESEPSTSFNEDFSVRSRLKSHKQDSKQDFERFIKLYCMFVGNDLTEIDD